MLTPAMVHYGQYEAVLAHRAEVLAQAFQEHPERFVRGIPQVKRLPESVWINKPKTSSEIVVA